MGFELIILGSNSAIPSFQRNPTSQVLKHNERLFLIDCGEGTQMQLNHYEIKSSRINHIFISHLHGDHYFGLMGLLSTMHLLGRTADMHLFGQPQLLDIVELQLTASDTTLRYKLIFIPLDPEKSAVIMDDEELSVTTIILSHRIPCTGFLFREKPKQRKLIKEKIDEYGIPVNAFSDIKKGLDYITDSNVRIKNEELTQPAGLPKSYAFCSDTIYDESILDLIKGVDLLYHESTFMHDMIARAKETYHTTSIEAGTIALKANVKKLLIGHFSSRYKTLEPMLLEAQSVFPNTELAIEGTKISI